MVEFVIVLPILLLLLLAILQFGVVFNNYITLTDAVRAGARQAAVGRSVADPTGAAVSRARASAADLDQSKLACHRYEHVGAGGGRDRDRLVPVLDQPARDGRVVGDAHRKDDGARGVIRPAPVRAFARVFDRAPRSRPRDERGQVLVWIVVSAIGLLAMTGFVIDIGHLFNAHRELQASTDAAALAAAQDLPDQALATTVAQNYGARAGGKNSYVDLPGVSTDVTTKCLTSAGLKCAPVNAIVVQQQASVPMFFLKVIGIDSVDIKARSTAAMNGGTPLPLDIMIVLDRTGSMCQPCSKMTNARAGVLAFLSAMDPAIDKIGLAVFPPATSASAACTSPPTSSYDDPAHPYVVVPLSSDFRTSPTGPLNASSQLVQTTNCLSPGGITSYATALDQAQDELNRTGRSYAQDVIVFFTDGEANYGPTYYGNTSSYRTQPCGQGINSSSTIRSAGTWIYGIVYDTNQTTRCKGWKASPASCAGAPAQAFSCDEVPTITAYNAVQQIVADPTKFFYQPIPGDLTTIFERIALDLSGPRLVDDDMT